MCDKTNHILTKIDYKKIYLIALLILCSYINSIAQKSDYEIQNSKKSIIIDGILDDAPWNSVVPVHPVQVGAYPRDSLISSPKYYLLQSDEFLVVGGSIPYLYQDTPKYLDDAIPHNATQIEIVLKNPRNPFHAFGFKLSPNGSKSEVLYQRSDINSTKREANSYWETNWEMASKLQDSTWSFEVIIPYRFLHLNTSLNPNIEMAIWYFNPEVEEISVWPFIDSKFANWNEKGVEQLRHAHLKSNKNISFRGKISGLTFSHNKNKNNHLDYSIGASGELHINDNHHVSAMINPDFANSRPLPFYINLGQFRYYQRDSRNQVYENESIFSFKWNENNTLIFPAQIFGDSLGFKYGRLDYYCNSGNFGFGTRQYLLPENWINQNHVRYHWNNNKSHLGIININDISKSNTKTIVGMNYMHYFENHHIIELKHVTNFTSNNNTSINLWERSRLSFNFKNEKLLGFVYGLGMNHYGVHYDNRLSFEDFQDYDALNAYLGYAWKNLNSSLFNTQNITFQNKFYVQEGDLISFAKSTIQYKAESQIGLQFGLAYSYQYERILETRNFHSDITIYTGVYGQSRLQLFAKSPFTRKTSYNVSWEFGEWYDGEFSLLDHSLGFHLGSRLYSRIHHIYLLHVRPSYPYTPLVHKHVINCDLSYKINKSFGMDFQWQSSNILDLVLGYCALNYSWKDKLQFSLIYRSKLSLDQINPNWTVNQSTNYHYGALKGTLFLF